MKVQLPVALILCSLGGLRSLGFPGQQRPIRRCSVSVITGSRTRVRKPIHLPQDFFQLTFHYLRFVQIIIALRSNQTLTSSLFLTPPSSLSSPRSSCALPPLSPASPARRCGPRTPAGHARRRGPRRPHPAPPRSRRHRRRWKKKKLFNILKIDSTFFEMLVQHF